MQGLLYNKETMYILYLQGWRAKDREKLQQKFDLSETECDMICKDLKEEGKNEKKEHLIVVAIFLFTTVFSLFIYAAQTYLPKSSNNPFDTAKRNRFFHDNVHIGTVISKGIEDADDNPYNDDYIIQYAITIKSHYEYEGKYYISNKTYVVSEDVYKSYEIGDTFDENNLKITP